MNCSDVTPRCMKSCLYHVVFIRTCNVFFNLFNVRFNHCTACTVYFLCLHVRLLRLPESSTLTTRLPSHPLVWLLDLHFSFYTVPSNDLQLSWAPGLPSAKSGPNVHARSSVVAAVRRRHLTMRYDTRCYFNVRSKADMNRLNLPHGDDN